MKRNVVVGIDIGTYQVKVVVCERGDKQDVPRVLGVGYAESRGLRHGYIIHQSDAIKSIKRAVRQAEQRSGIPIKSAFISVGGIGVTSTVGAGSSVISRADSEITDLDVERAVTDSQEALPGTAINNRKVIHTIPLIYRIDGKEVLGRPHGMKGSKLEVKTLFVTCLENHLNELIQVVEDAGIDITDVMAAPLAASFVTLNRSQKIAGCVLANIGSETVSLVVYENNIPISLEVFPIGSNDITNDIALGLQVSIEEAEVLKMTQEDATRKISKKKLEEIILARLSDIFDLIDAHLKKIHKNGLLPAGIVITGGGSNIATIEDLAKAYLQLPSRVGTLVCDISREECIPNNVDIKDATWAVSYGLCVFGLSSEGDGVIRSGAGMKVIRDGSRKVTEWIKQFLP